MKKILLIPFFAFFPLFLNANDSTKLITEHPVIQANTPFWAAFKISMKPGWHTYWRNPGETGFPTTIKWDLPEGFRASEIHWITPHRFKFMDLINYGYENEAYFLVQIHPPENLTEGQSITLKGQARWLECKDICVPQNTAFEKELTVSDLITSTPNPLFKELREQLPVSLPEQWKLSAHIHEGSFGILIRPLDPSLPLPNDIYFFSKDEGFTPSWHHTLSQIGNALFLQVPTSDPESDIPEHIQGVLYNPNGWSSTTSATGLLVDTKITPFPSFPKDTTNTSLPLALIFAFIGGLILNLMPCVFPVLSLKIIGFVQHAGKDSLKTKLHGLMFAAGVLTSFWALSGLLLALRASGELLGWGFQLQSPFFIVFLILLLVVISLNFAGLFEIGTSLISTGSRFGSGSGYIGTFSSGILATVLATPCTAPFMGTALGFALTIPAIQSLSIFTALAIGMSTPYLILSFSPGLLRFLPRPGAWMETFKQAMAFPLLATVIWLLWVLSIQTNNTGIILVLFGALLISASAWAYGRFCSFSKTSKEKLIGHIIALALLIAAIAISYSGASINTSVDENAEMLASKWEQYSEELVEQYRSEGRAMYIDFTAAWCLTCQANKANLFTKQAVVDALEDNDVILIKGDWTRQDPKVTKALAKYGRSGVPTNIIYAPKVNSQPTVLPSILTPKIVLDVINSF